MQGTCEQAQRDGHFLSVGKRKLVHDSHGGPPFLDVDGLGIGRNCLPSRPERSIWQIYQCSAAFSNESTFHLTLTHGTAKTTPN